MILICSELHWSHVRTSFLLLCQEKPYLSLFSLSRRPIATDLVDFLEQTQVIRMVENRTIIPEGPTVLNLLCELPPHESSRQVASISISFPPQWRQQIALQLPLFAKSIRSRLFGVKLRIAVFADCIFAPAWHDSTPLINLGRGGGGELDLDNWWS